MKINTKIRYGLRTLLEVSCQKNKDGILQKEIAANQQISEKYLDPIIAGLKVAGLLVNAGGKKSGYILNKPANQITVLDVFKAFENGPALVHCLENPSVCERSSKCAPFEYWSELNSVILNHMKNTNLETLCKRNSKLNKK